MSYYNATKFNRIYEIIRIVVYRCSLLLTLINFVLIKESTESHMGLKCCKHITETQIVDIKREYTFFLFLNSFKINLLGISAYFILF